MEDIRWLSFGWKGRVGIVREGYVVGKFMVKEEEDEDWNFDEFEFCDNVICKELVMWVESNYREDI